MAQVRICRDVDEMRRRLIGWDRDVVPLSDGATKSLWRQVMLNDISVYEEHIGNTVADWSMIKAGRLNIVVQLAGPAAKWAGLEFVPGGGMACGTGRDFHAVMKPGFEAIEFCVAEELLPKLADVHAGMRRHGFAPARCVLSIDEATFARCRKLRAELFGDPLTTEAALQDPTLAELLRHRTVALLRRLAHSSPGLRDGLARPRRIPGYGLAVRAIALIDSEAASVKQVSTVAQALGLSTRALQRAFRHWLGVSPHRYLLARKLEIARRELLAAHDVRSPVTEAAMNAGFEHFSRFSAYYRQLYGEAPSTTLARVIDQLPRRAA